MGLKRLAFIRARVLEGKKIGLHRTSRANFSGERADRDAIRQISEKKQGLSQTAYHVLVC
jgi:hypothetical protein